MNKKLKSYLETPLESLDAIRSALSICANYSEVEEVIGLIPSCFGHFEVDKIEQEYFTISNDSDDYVVDEEKYSWYEAEDLKSSLTKNIIKEMKVIAYDNYNYGYILSEDDFDDFATDWEYAQYNMKAIIQAFELARGEDFIWD